MPWQEKASEVVLFFKEVRQELRKVSWPKREDVFRATLMTLVATLLLSIYLGLTDFLLQNGIRPLFIGTVNVWTLILVAYFGGILYIAYLTTKD
jgi:preprotein translocase subunit SecE